MRKNSFKSEPTKLATVEQARERYMLSRGMIMKIAEESKAVRRFGRAVRIDVGVLDEAIENY